MVVKHTNPCGIASRGDLLEAYRLAVRADPISAFGGIVAFNRCAVHPAPSARVDASRCLCGGCRCPSQGGGVLHVAAICNPWVARFTAAGLLSSAGSQAREPCTAIVTHVSMTKRLAPVALQGGRRGTGGGDPGVPLAH